MKLDEKGLGKAVETFVGVSNNWVSFEDALGYEQGPLAAAIKAYLKATNSVIVPVSPTEAMKESGGQILREGYAGAPEGCAGSVYRAMIQAAQEGE